MDESFWRARWQNQEIGFHQPEATPALVRHAARLPAGAPVLVPLCGKAHDLAWLAERGHPVVGVELVEQALTDFYAEHQLEPERREEAGFVRFEAGGVVTWAGDFFGLGPTALGRLTAVFDRAALVALPEPMRRRYAAHLLSLLEPGASVLLVTFVYDQAQMNGPPFSVSPEEVHALYGASCEIERLEDLDILDESPRFRERGLTSLREMAWHLRVR